MSDSFHHGKLPILLMKTPKTNIFASWLTDFYVQVIYISLEGNLSERITETSEAFLANIIHQSFRAVWIQKLILRSPLFLANENAEIMTYQRNVSFICLGSTNLWSAHLRLDYSIKWVIKSLSWRGSYEWHPMRWYHEKGRRLTVLLSLPPRNAIFSVMTIPVFMERLRLKDMVRGSWGFCPRLSVCSADTAEHIISPPVVTQHNNPRTLLISSMRFHVPSVAKLPLIFSNLLNLGTRRDTTKEYGMNLIHIRPMDLTECFFVVSLPVFK